MAEIENVPGAPAGAAKDVLGSGEQAIGWSEQERRVEIALDAPVVAHDRPGLVERDPPVDTDHVAAGLAHVAEERRRPDAEVNRGHAERAKGIEDARGVRLDELAVVARAERADPGVEHLHGLDAGFDLRGEVVAHHRRELLAEAVPRGGVAVHERFGVRVVGRRPTFDRVRGQRERRAAEPDERNSAVELAADEADRLQHVRERLAWFEHVQALDVSRRPHGTLDRGTLAFDEVEGQAHGLEREQQVGEENRGVNLDGADRLQRDLGGQLRRAAELEQGAPLAQHAVLGHVPAGLSHEPDGSGVDRLAPARAEEAIGGCRLRHTDTSARASATRSSSQSGLKRTDAPSDFSSIAVFSPRK